MGRKHKHSSKRANNDKSAATAGQHAPDPCVACLALHPQGDFVAVAIHDTVRISKCKYVSKCVTFMCFIPAQMRAVVVQH